MDPADAPGPVTIARPLGWMRRSVALLVEDDATGKANPASIVVTREELGAGDSPASLCNAHVRALREQPAFRVVARRIRDLPRGPAVEVVCEWVNERGPIVQSATFAETAEGEATTLTVVICTCAIQDREAMFPVFAERVAALWPTRTVSGIAPRGEALQGGWSPPELPIPGQRSIRRR